MEILKKKFNWRRGKKILIAAFIVIFAIIDVGPAMVDIVFRLAGTTLQERNIVDKIYLARKNPNVVDNFSFGPQMAEAALDPAELEYMVNVGPIVGSTVANYVYAAFFNPVNSGRTAVVKRIAVRSNAVAAANWVNLTVRRITAVTTDGTLIAASDIPRKNTGSVNSVMIIRHTGPGVTFDGTVNSRIMSQAMAGAAGAFYSFRDITFGVEDESIILQPGQGIALFQEAAGSASHNVIMYVEWEEVAVAPTPQNEFLFAFPRVENAAGAVNWVYNSFFNPSASGRTAIIKRIWFGSETCDAASIYTNNLVIRRTSSASGGTGIPAVDIPRKHTGSAASNMDLRHTNVTVGLVGGVDSRLAHVTPCGAANQAHGWMQINFHANDEKLILQPGQGIAFITETAGEVDQLNRMIIEWQEVPFANTPTPRNEYIFATGRVADIAAALGTTFYTFFNPVGSGRTVTINRLAIMVDVDAAATYSTFNFQRINAASAGILITAADIPRKHTGSAVSVMEIRHCGPACATAITTTYVGHRDIAAGGMADSGILKVDGSGALGQIIGQREIVFGNNEKFILQPGEGLGFFLNRLAGDVDHFTKVLVEWGETATTPPSRNQYLIDIGSVGGSTAAAFNYMSFFNPGASGRTAILNRVSVRVDTVAGALYIPLRLRRIIAASGGTAITAVNIPRKHTATANSAMDIRRSNPAVTFLQGIEGSLINVETPGAIGTAIAPATSGWREILFATDERIILQPGQGIALGQTAAGDVDFRVKMLIEWEEVPFAATPASQGEFLMTTEPSAGSLDADFVYASFFNPVGSGRNYVVTRIGIRANRIGALTAPGFIPITLRRITSASGGATLVVGADLPRKHTGTGVPTAEIRRAGVAVGFAGGIDSRLLSVTAPGGVVQAIGVFESEIIHGDELILAPGEGIALYQEVAAGDTLIQYRFSFQWREVALAAPALNQSAYRWRNDDGTETTATWRAGENTAITGVSLTEIIRLRMEIEETNSVAATVNARLEFSSDATACTGGTWTALDMTTTAWRVTDSANITNAGATTAQLAGSARPFVAGRIFDTQNQDATGVSLNNSHTEWEWAIRGDGAAANTTFRFRVTNAGTVLGTYTNCAQLTTAVVAETLTFTISDNAIGFGTLIHTAARFANGAGTGSASEVEAHNIAVTTNASQGYALTITGTTLTSGANTITAIGATNLASAIGTEQFGVRATATGGVGTVSAPYSAGGFALDTAAFPDEIGAATGPSATTTFSIRYLANIAPLTEAGSYTAILTYIVTGRF